MINLHTHTSKTSLTLDPSRRMLKSFLLIFTLIIYIQPHVTQEVMSLSDEEISLLDRLGDALQNMKMNPLENVYHKEKRKEETPIVDKIKEPFYKSGAKSKKAYSAGELLAYLDKMARRKGLGPKSLRFRNIRFGISR